MQRQILALALILAATPAYAQVDADAQMQAMEQAQAAAMAGSARPGDEALTCEAMQAEIVTSMNDPAFQAMIASNGAWAQGQMDQANAARGQAMGNMAMGMGMGLASAFIPGMGMAASMAMRAQTAGMQAQANQNQAEMMQRAQSMEAHMPMLYRMQRVTELAQAKQCPFMQEMSGAAPQ